MFRSKQVVIRWWVCLTAVSLFLFHSLPAQAQFSLTTLDTPFLENFNTLAAAGTSSVTPTGWYFAESGSNADTTYAAGTGSSNVGNTYSFGDSSDRAFGGLQSGSLLPLIGASYTNNTSFTLTSLDISYVGEQWRIGTMLREDRLNFQYSTDATSLTSGTWLDINALDFVAPVQTSVPGALDGNNVANQTAVSATLIVPPIANGTTFWLRWVDVDATGADDGLAVDDFAITAHAGDTLPVLWTTSPAHQGVNITINSDVTVQFNEAVTTSGNWLQIACNRSGLHPVTDAVVSGGPTSFTINPNVDFVNAEACTATIFAAQVSDQDGTADPMAADFSWSFTVISGAAGVCGDNNETPIYQIQGNTTASPMNGATGVTIEGVVVGDFQAANQLNGFFVQEESSDSDGDVLTSDGIFVLHAGTAVSSGDVVRVQGNVLETSNLTSINPVTTVTVCSSGVSLPPAASVTLPVASSSYLERFEGMVIALPQVLTVTDHFFLGRGGLVTLAANGRLPQPTQFVAPGATAVAMQTTNLLSTLILDDGSLSEYPNPIPYPTGGLSASNTLRAGDTTNNVQGVLTQTWSGFVGSFIAYRVHPITPPIFTAANPRPTPPTLAGNIKVASFNLLEYFNGDGMGGGFLMTRGASNLTEFDRQRDKLITAIVAMDADIVGLMELENDGYGVLNALPDLVNGLNAATAPGTYALINPGFFPLGWDVMTVGIIYQPATVVPVGTAVTDTTTAFSARNRPPLAQTFSLVSNSEQFTVVVNHWQSKGSSCATAAPPAFPFADPDTGDGQGNCNLTRTLAATQLLSWLATNPTGTADPDVLIVGDLNSYLQENPLTALKNGGFVDVVETVAGSNSYSFNLGGQWGSLDHALANASLLAQVTAVTTWHINADEPRALDYNTENTIPGLYDSSAYRSADHDPLLLSFTLGELADYSDLTSSYGVAWHGGNGALRLGSAWTADSSFAPGNDNGSGDDGVFRNDSWVAGSPASLTITVTGGTGYLAGWFDWNSNGVFEVTEKAVGQAVVAGTQTINFTVGAAFNPVVNNTVNGRFRLYAAEPLSPRAPDGSEIPTGPAATGEVEDYTWVFSPTAVSLHAPTIYPGNTWVFWLLLVALAALLTWGKYKHYRGIWP